VTVLAVIPARRGSTRLINKPLRLLGGVPLVVRVWQRVVESGVADSVVVATDDAEIAAAVRDAGGQAAHTRADHASGTDRVAEVAQHSEYKSASVVLNVQGDEPFVHPSAMLGAVTIVSSGAARIGTAAVPASAECLSSPHCVKVVCNDAHRALYFSRAPIPYLRDPSDADVRDQHIRQHIGVYAYDPAALQQWVSLPVHPLEQIERLEQLRPLAAGMSIGVALTEPAQMGGIDTEDDLARANALWESLYSVRSFA
jgi:3-deoxy-manno-octulosonate cytidylyltransferase (CMP-KDO synthetase)